MDIFTDVDIFKEIVEASTRGISVYILLDEFNFNHFLSMTEKQGCQVQRLRVRIPCGFSMCFFLSIYCIFFKSFGVWLYILIFSFHVPFLSQLNLRHVKLYYSKGKTEKIYIFRVA